MQSIHAYPDIANLLISAEKLLMSAELKSCVSRTDGVCHVIHIFLDLSKVRYNCAKFHHSRISMTDFRLG